MVRGSEAAIIRTAETLDSLFANQRIPAWLEGTNAPPSPWRERAIAAGREP